MSQVERHFRLRVPPEVKRWVEQQAQTNRRSMTAQIIVVLERAMQTTAGNSFQATPAVVPERDALAGGSSHQRY